MLKKILFFILKKRLNLSRVEAIYRTIVSASELEKFSNNQIDKLIGFVSKNNSYYKNIKYINNSVPLLTKPLINKNFKKLKSKKFFTKTYLNSSGGSTGKSQTFLQDYNYSNWSSATVLFYYRNILGVDPNCAKKIVLWGSERDIFNQRDYPNIISNWLTNTVFLNSFKLDEKILDQYIQTIKNYQPVYIRGYAGSLYQLSKQAKNRGVSFKGIKFVSSAAEKLRDFMKKEITETFNCPVYDFYGSREVGAIAGECTKNNMHLFTFNNIVEIVDRSNKRICDGKKGKIVVSNLHNYSMPLIRYEIGDIGSITSKKCDCRLKLPILSEIDGRITDHFVKKNGEMIHGEYFTHLFYFRNWVKEFQVTQESYDLIIIDIVKKGLRSIKDIEDISNKIKLVMGNRCIVKWRYVNNIKKTPQGKYIFTRCLVKQ